MLYDGFNKGMDAAQKSGGISRVSTRFRLTRDGAAEPVSRDQILRRVRTGIKEYSFSLFS